MFDFSSLFTIALAFIIAVATPGPATLAVATISMSSGRKPGLMFGLGLSAGLAFWGLVAATGLGAILQASTYALTALKILGGLYLLWLALNAARSASRKNSVLKEVTQAKHNFRRGLLLNLSNPKAVVAWMAVLALGLGNEQSSLHIFIAAGTCILLGILINCGYALIFSTPGAMKGYQKTRRWIEGVVAGLFAIAGFGLIRSAFARQ
ncbi:MAG: LysE family transporter [Sneathiellales bacterium]|nr:LysE family transporter [Sneathiellales bacterium]